MTTDVVVFTVNDGDLSVLLMRRGHGPFAGWWALPGGYVSGEEDLEQSACRTLTAKTGLQSVYLEQLYTFGAPARDPRERTISVAYLALLPSHRINGQRAVDGSECAWHPLSKLPSMPFDHRHIVDLAAERLAGKFHYTTIALQLLPERFTLSHLQGVYETVLGESLDKRNFRKRVRAWGCIEDSGKTLREGNHRPARLYKSREADVQIIK